MEESNKKNYILLAYKLLIDLLFLLLLSLAFMLIGESIVPGLVSEHISFTKIIVAMIFDFGLIFWLSEKVHSHIQKPVSEIDSMTFSKKKFYFFSLFLFALIAIVIRGFNIFVIVAILTSTAIIFGYLFSLLFEKE